MRRRLSGRMCNAGPFQHGVREFSTAEIGFGELRAEELLNCEAHFLL
jgi:hypothetical protein